MFLIDSLTYDLVDGKQTSNASAAADSITTADAVIDAAIHELRRSADEPSEHKEVMETTSYPRLLRVLWAEAHVLNINHNLVVTDVGTLIG